MGLTLTSLLTPNLVNVTSISSNIFDLDLNLKGINDVSSLSGYSSSMPYAGYLSTRLPLVTISGKDNISPEGIPAARPLKHAADLDDLITDDLSWQHGKHYLQTGLTIMFNTKRQNVGTATNGQWTFTGATTGSGLADFLTGNAATFTQVSDQRRIPVHATVISPYVEERYKLHRNLTATVGIRFSHLPLPQTAAGTETIFESSAYNSANAPTVSTTGKITSTSYDATNGLVTNGNGVPDNFFDKHAWYVGPNVGIAWDVLGNGKYSMRGGYGLNYTRIFTNQDCSFNCVQNPPYLSSTNLVGVTFGQAATSGSAAQKTIQTLQSSDPTFRLRRFTRIA
jgi:hypothetical protein